MGTVPLKGETDGHELDAGMLRLMLTDAGAEPFSSEVTAPFNCTRVHTPFSQTRTPARESTRSPLQQSSAFLLTPREPLYGQEMDRFLRLADPLGTGVVSFSALKDLPCWLDGTDGEKRRPSLVRNIDSATAAVVNPSSAASSPKDKVAFVTVPDGVSPGDVIAVEAPDGTHVRAAIPIGCPAGSSFGVAYTPVVSTAAGVCTSSASSTASSSVVAVGASAPDSAPDLAPDLAPDSTPDATPDATPKAAAIAAATPKKLRSVKLAPSQVRVATAAADGSSRQASAIHLETKVIKSTPSNRDERTVEVSKVRVTSMAAQQQGSIRLEVESNSVPGAGGGSHAGVDAGANVTPTKLKKLASRGLGDSGGDGGSNEAGTRRASEGGPFTTAVGSSGWGNW
jgi:hypothetical protein